MRFQRLANLGVIFLLAVSLLPVSSLQFGKAQAAAAPSPGGNTITSCQDLPNKLQVPNAPIQPTKVVSCHDDVNRTPANGIAYPAVATTVQFPSEDYFLTTGLTAAQMIQQKMPVYAPCTYDKYGNCSVVNTSGAGYGTNAHVPTWEKLAGYNNTSGYINNFQESLNCQNPPIPVTFKKDDGTVVTMSCSTTSVGTKNPFASWDYTYSRWNSAGYQISYTIQRMEIFRRPSGLPNLVPFGSPQATVVANDGTKTGPTSREAKIDTTTASIILDGISVKNIGPMPTLTQTDVKVTIRGENSLNTGTCSEYIDVDTSTVPILAANAVYTVPTITLSITSRSFTSFLSDATKSCNISSLGIDVNVNQDKTVVESNYNDNDQYTSDFIIRPALRITLADQSGNPIDAQVDLTIKGTTNRLDVYNGGHEVFILDKPVPVYDATVQAVVNGTPTGAIQTQRIDDYKLYIVSFKIDLTKIPLPDLVPTFGGATAVIKYQGQSSPVTVKLDQASEINFGTDITSFQINNLGIKNIGQADLPATHIQSFLTLGHINDFPSFDDSSWALKAGQEKTVSTPVYSNSDPSNQTLKAFLGMFPAFVTKYGTAEASFTFKITPDSSLLESDTGNNIVDSAANIGFIALQVSVHSADGQKIKLAEIDVWDSASNKTLTSVSDKDGVAIIAPTESMQGVTQRSLGVKVYLGGQLAIDLGSQAFTHNELRKLDAVVTGYLIIEPSLQQDFGNADDGTNTTTQADAGTVKIALVGSGSGGGQVILNDVGSGKPNLLLSAQIVHGLATFSKNTQPSMIDGAYQLQSSTASYDFPVDTGVNTTISYAWPEPTRSSDPSQATAPKFSYKASAVNFGKFTMLLPETCQTSHFVNIKFCWYDDSAGTTLSQQKLLMTVVSQINRYQSWTQYPLSNLRRVIFTTMSPNSPAVAYTSANEDYIIIDDPYVNYWQQKQSETIPTVIDHEMFHRLDWQYGVNTFLSEKTEQYDWSVYDQLNSTTGRMLWDISSYNCTYSGKPCSAGYSSQILENTMIPVEPFAEEHSSVCVYGSKVSQQLANIKSVWGINYPGVAIPKDLLDWSNEVSNRLQGKDTHGSVYSPAMAGWYNDCVTTTSP
ncbi:MAG TPA: hypothetical protein VMQ44_01010 [Candidatus Saccharimonadales bacterium]|nr:hypothetical protein [Candidatus Saccharimonadales bacterium]